MAGLGGFMGYGLCGIDWSKTELGIMLGGQLYVTFAIITVIFVICVASTLFSFKEIPLEFLESIEFKEQMRMKVKMHL